jgi:HEPN domain-containing protein
VTSISLARSYFLKPRKRLWALETLFEHQAYSDVVREAQELVELALKGMLRFVGIEPPKRHDVGRLVLANRDRLPQGVAAVAERLEQMSRQLQEERERAFYGDEDFIPTDEYTYEEAAAALEGARFVVGLLESFPERE